MEHVIFTRQITTTFDFCIACCIVVDGKQYVSSIVIPKEKEADWYAEARVKQQLIEDVIRAIHADKENNKQ